MAVLRWPGDGPALHRFSARIMLTLSAILFISSITLGAYTLLASTSTPLTSTSVHIVRPRPATATNREQIAVSTLSQQYMTALLQQHYEAMWPLLHPDIQAIWPGQTAFINYWRHRFDGYQVKSFSMGKVRQLSYWVNPETMTRYDHVDVMPISLQIENRLPAAQQVQLAPQFQHPQQIFQNLPFIVKQTSSTRWSILNGGPADLEAPILPPVTPAYQVVNVPILMYHHISDAPTTNVLDHSLTVTTAMFNSQLAYLKRRGYHTITLNQLMDALYYGSPLPDKPIILTFDDGYDDAYKFAYPLLESHGFSGVFYIITGKVGWSGQATWDELRDMLANGMQIGSHTVHHVDMGLTYEDSPMLAQQEARDSQIDLQRHLAITIQHFCYPAGGPFKGTDVALQNSVVSLLAHLGYTDATTDPGPTGITQSSLGPLALLRLRVDGGSTLQHFMSSMPF